MSRFDQLLVISPRGHERIYFLQPGSSLTLGRSSDNEIVLRDASVSRRHARLEVEAEACRVVDLESRHGLFVNGERTSGETLAAGDKVRIGNYLLEIRGEEARDASVEHTEAEEYVEISVGREPTIVESIVPGEATLTEHGLEQSMNDTSVARMVIHVPGHTREVALTSDEITIGRAPDNDICLVDGHSSNHHAKLLRAGEGYELRDLGSKNGTWVGGENIDQRLLANGDNIRIGESFLVYKTPVRREALSVVDLAPAGEGGPVRRPIVVIPGIMGSELWHEGEVFWPDVHKAAKHPELLGLPDQGLEVGGIARHVIVIPNVIKLDAYSKLVDFFEESLGYTTGKDLLQFPYDWRRDNRKSARKLKEAVDDWRENVLGKDTKITVIAHSMGSLVARYYLQCLGGAEVVDRLVLMGAPCFGSPHVVQALVSGPNILPLGLANDAFHRVITSLESSYQLVPVYPCVTNAKGEPINLHEENSWVAPECQDLLADARDFHREIGSEIDVPTTCIFGYGVKTVTRIVVAEEGKDGWEKARFILERAGDNRVAERHAFIEGADLHPVRQYHGSLWTDEDVQLRLRLELVK